MLADYDQCFSRLLVHEGGYTNDPRDPGGPTNYGITIFDARKYGAEFHWVDRPTAADIRAMPRWFAADVYKPKYWDALHCSDLPCGLDDTIFDYGVNSGIGRAGKVLRRVLGLSDHTYIVDASVIAALAKRDPIAVINAVNDERMQFLRGLRTFDHFGPGWTARVKEVRAFSNLLAKNAKTVNAKKPVDMSFNVPAVMAKGMVPPPLAAANAVAGTLASGAVASAFVGSYPTAAVVTFGVVSIVNAGLQFIRHIEHQHNFDQKQEAPSGPVTVVPAAA